MSGASSFSAAEQGLGYIYQPRLALLRILSLPEDTAVYIEKADDLEFVEGGGSATLASLKHKAPGETLTDLSTDFWKSVRIWLTNYLANGKAASDSHFVLFTTATVADTSFLRYFVQPNPADTQAGDDGRAEEAQAAISISESKALKPVKAELDKLDPQELEDFYSRISIYDGAPRITEIPELIAKQLRTVRRESRQSLFERLEGWWINLMIQTLAGKKEQPVYGYEVSDKLASLAEEYRSDNLPITFRSKMPDGEIDVANDSRIFVEQLRVLGVSPTRIQNAILDYYRAFAQRSSWARENLLVSGEIEEYEDRLVDEWTRYREIIFEHVDDSSSEEVCLGAGKELYLWAEMQTSMLRIRERVTEPYVVRGTFHILANLRPAPRVYWHPRFLARLQDLLGAAA